MTERSIIDAAARLRRTGEPYLVASVVCPDHPGARLLLTRFRWVTGTTTGGCLDGELSRKAWWRTRDGAALVVSYDADCSEEDELRAAFGLDGTCRVDVLIERAGIHGRIDALEVAERCLRDQRRGAVATIVRAPTTDARVGARIALVAGGALEEEADRLPDELRARIAAALHATIETGRPALVGHGAVDVVIEAIVPPPRLFVFGTGHDAVPLVAFAKGLGWDVIVCAGEPRHATRDRFALADEVCVVASPADATARIAAADRPVAVVLCHDRDRQHATIQSLLATPVRYIGTTVAPDQLADPRIRPVAAGGPSELALALVADIHATLRAPASRPHPVGRPSQQLVAVS